MIDDIITDEQLAAEEALRAKFHSMRKHTHSRAARQAAWRAWQEVIDQRHWRARRMHPIAPAYQWSSFHEDTKGWTYPGSRTLDLVEVERHFPGALRTAPYQNAPHRFVVCSAKGLRLSVRLGDGVHSPRGSCARWLPEMQIWRVYSTSVSARPYAHDPRTTRAVGERSLAGAA